MEFDRVNIKELVGKLRFQARHSFLLSEQNYIEKKTVEKQPNIKIQFDIFTKSFYMAKLVSKLNDLK